MRAEVEASVLLPFKHGRGQVLVRECLQARQHELDYQLVTVRVAPSSHSAAGEAYRDTALISCLQWFVALHGRAGVPFRRRR